MRRKRAADEAAEGRLAEEDDTEGQSMAALLAMRQLSKAPRPVVKRDEPLPPLTKRFPRMRDDAGK